MANTSSAQQNGDWFSSQKQYWDNWFEQQRNFFGAAAGPQQGPQAQWAELLQTWQKALSGGQEADKMADVRQFQQYFTRAGEAYLGMLQQFYQGTGQAKPLNEMVQEWIESLKKAFAGQMDFSGMPGFPGMVAAGKDPFAALDPLNFFAGMPGIGYTREKQEQLNHLYQMWEAYQAKTRDYAASMAKVGLEAAQKFQDYVVHPPEGAAPLTSLKEVYAKWVDICEDIYARYAMTEEYTRLYGEVVNALMAFKKQQNKITDEVLDQFNMPTRAEADSLHKRLHALQREVAELKAALKPAAKKKPVVKKGKKK
ncbi:MAG: hypothetical protein KGQ70_03495 [Alphaproteobacteria bacterium]|nr:hypothetical protein [Alphaproteobacteria bacterium]